MRTFQGVSRGGRAGRLALVVLAMAWLGSLGAMSAAHAESEKARIQQLIADFEAGKAGAKGAEIYRYRGPQGRLYLIMSLCCDQFNYLYTADGERVCAPSGGLTGRGDGNCPPGIKPEALLSVPPRPAEVAASKM